MKNTDLKACPIPVGYIFQNHKRVPVSCKSWDCPYCGHWRKVRLSSRVLQGFLGHGKVIQWTLTQARGTSQDLMDNWNRLKNLLKKEEVIPKDFRYFYVKEFHKSGERHLHILTTQYIDHFVLKTNWRYITGGESYIVWLNSKEIEKAGGYAFKYLTKSYLLETRYRPKERRYGFSRHAGFREANVVLPLLGDFWEIIGDPNCSPYKFVEHRILPGQSPQVEWSLPLKLEEIQCKHVLTAN